MKFSSDGTVDVGMVTGWMARVLFPVVQHFALLRILQAEFKAHLTACSSGTGGCFHGDKAAEA
jgi:hypothetical protein